jgi:hypothetical protein
MDWLAQRWVVEALIFIGAGLILAKIFCMLADLLDRE